jgi:hypothetical protein
VNIQTLLNRNAGKLFHGVAPFRRATIFRCLTLRGALRPPLAIMSVSRDKFNRKHREFMRSDRDWTTFFPVPQKNRPRC